MKFAEHITESSVPEWGDMYIDYKLGKKKIKQCRSFLESSNKELFTNYHPFNSTGTYNAKPVVNHTESTPLLRPYSDSYTKEQSKCIDDFINDWVIKSELEKVNAFYLWQLDKIARPKFDGLALQMKIFTKRKENGLFLRESRDSSGSQQQERNIEDNYNRISKLEMGKKEKTKHTVLTKLKYKLYEYDLMPSLPTFDEFPRLKKFFHGKKADLPQNKSSEPCATTRTKRSGTVSSLDNLTTMRSLSFIWKGQETFVISDDQASRQLSNAIIEFYLFLELLKSYRSINVEGFRKIVKKFDKVCKTSELPGFLERKLKKSVFYKDMTNEENHDLILKWETKLSQWYLDDLSTSPKDRKARSRSLANSTIRANMDELTVQKSNLCSNHMFFSGLNIALSLCIISLAMYYGSQSTVSSELHKILLPIWGGWYLVTMMGLLFQLDCFIWFKNKVNYRFIIFGEILPTSKFGTSLFHNDFASTRIPSHLYYASTILVLCCISSFFSLSITKTLEPWTSFFFILLIIILVEPQLILPHMENFYISSFWNLKTLVRLICSGLYPVKFADFFLGDMICSLTYSLSDVALYFCLFNKFNKCGSSNSYSMGVLLCLPSYFRMVQCIRRYFDSGDWFPHLLNAVKYFFTVMYGTLLMLYRIKPQGFPLDIKFWFVLIATINSVASALWDIILDWSLFQSLSWSTFLLRKDLYIAGNKNWKTGKYPVKGRLFYYFAILLDIVVRFQWLAYIFFPAHIQQNAMVSLAIAFAELFRRFVWMIFRIENEHVANVHIFKISSEVQLPYNIGRDVYSMYLQNEQDTSRSQAPAADNQEIQSIYSNYSAVSLTDDIMPYSPGQQPPFRADTSSKFMRRGSTVDMVTKAIPWAHYQDFQRNDLSRMSTNISVAEQNSLTGIDASDSDED